MTAASVVSRMTLGFAAARTEVAANATPWSTRSQAAWLIIVATMSTRTADARPKTASPIRAALPSGCAAHSSSVVMVETVTVPGMSANTADFLSRPAWVDRTGISPSREEPQLRFQVAGVDVSEE
jgi:hypothetical protein